MAARWPNLFVVGAAKAGTTSLHEYLAAHPQVHMSPVKEPHYFSRLRPSAERRPYLPTIDREADYLRLFRDAGDRAVLGESSTSYLTVPEAAERIRCRCPEAKAVVVLREPVARAHSHFLADSRDGVERRSFAAAIDDELSGREPGQWGVGGLYVAIGRYAEAVERYAGVFGQDLKVLFFEEMVADPPAAVGEVLRFLALDPAPAESLVQEPHNPHREPRARTAAQVFASPLVRRLSRRLLPRGLRARAKESLTRPAPKPELPAAERARLEAAFAADVARLGELLGRRPPWPAYLG